MHLLTAQWHTTHARTQAMHAGLARRHFLTAQSHAHIHAGDGITFEVLSVELRPAALMVEAAGLLSSAAAQPCTRAQESSGRASAPHTHTHTHTAGLTIAVWPRPIARLLSALRLLGQLLCGLLLPDHLREEGASIS